MKNLTDNMKQWAAENQPETIEEKEKLKVLSEDVERILEQRRTDEAEFWASVPDQLPEDMEPKVPLGCKATAIVLALILLGVGFLGAWETIEIILSWI